VTSRQEQFRLLITGASGLLGSNLVLLASQRPLRFDGQNPQAQAAACRVIGVLHHSIAAPERQPDADENSFFETITADLCQPGAVERVFAQARPDAVIHCAAMTDVDRCEVNPDEARRINAELAGNIARAAAQNRVQLLHISTDSVFDGERGSYREEDTPNPVNIYSQTKLDGERLVANAYPEAIIARVDFYGWSWQGRRSLAEWFFHHLSANRPVSGFYDLTFCPLLANDMVDILLRMLERRLQGVYHVVSSESQTKLDFGRMLAREFGLDENLISPASYRSAGMRASRSKLLTLSCARLEQALGEKMPGQAESVKRFVELYRQGYPRLLRGLFTEPDLPAGLVRSAAAG
jgi:dTDP-4-dehydrorhamnose reductase